MAIVNAFIKLADPAYQNLPMRERLKDIVEGLFRVFDSNGNGIIESFELNEIVSDVVSGIATIVATVIDYLEPHFLKVNDPPYLPVVFSSTTSALFWCEPSDP
jgi:hypothetical protein